MIQKVVSVVSNKGWRRTERHEWDSFNIGRSYLSYAILTNVTRSRRLFFSISVDIYLSVEMFERTRYDAFICFPL